jgi:hypothetical protein
MDPKYESSENQNGENPESRQNHKIRCRHNTGAPGSDQAAVGRSEGFGSGVDGA